MAAVDVKLDHPGMREMLNSPEVAAMCVDAARKIAVVVRGSVPAGTDVAVDEYRTDRAAASVTIRDAAGKLWQVRDGVLTRAAGSIGAEVKARG